MLKHCLSALYVLFSAACFAQNTPFAKSDSLPEILVKSAWASDVTPVTFKNFTKESLEKSDFGQDLPYLLQNTPSVVATSDAGTGIGYTSFRIRGSDPTRVNVTVNGIPYNDAESHAVYWVDMPDIFSSTENIQIQRGVGTSANGAGAFGASINLNTNTLQLKSSVKIKIGAGSFGTKRATFQASSGLRKGFSADVKVSKILSNGYIDRASSDLFSYDFGLSWLGKNKSARFNFIDGRERTYQSWYGLPIQLLDTLRTYNPAGTERSPKPYENQVDSYRQTHYQFFYKQKIGQNTNFDIALYATKGKGFYEEYKAQKALAEYKISSVDTSDLVQRRWLDNWLTGLVFGYRCHKNKVDFTLGGGANRYTGNHFGEVIWAAKLTNLANVTTRWYEDASIKTDVNIYAKINYIINSKLTSYVDLQVRNVTYNFIGKDKKFNNISQRDALFFFNPKFGFAYILNEKNNIYTSFGIANREPNRDDYVQSSEASRPKSEQLQNVELGWKHQTKNTFFSGNLFFMNYKNQLVLTGKINDIGAYNRVNVAKSFRAGIEFDAAYKWKKWSAEGNLTLSENKILNFTEYIDVWDDSSQKENKIGKTDIAFSPKIIAAATFNYQINKNISCSLSNKYVGKQYIDNTKNEIASLPAYSTKDFRFNYDFVVAKKHKTSISFQINNFLNKKYSSNAWTYHYISDGFDPRSSNLYTVKDGNAYRDIGLFPQAGRNYMVGLTLNF
jgi:iron complex outermembrane recepter protein